MDKKTKKKVKNYILGGIAVVIVALLALLPTLTASDGEKENLVILSGVAERGSISQTLAGGGTLTEQKGVAVSVPSGVEVTEYLVKNGDMVSEGDPVALVDRVSVMTTITETQEKLDELTAEIEDVDTEELQEDDQRYISDYLWLTEEHRIYEALLNDLFALYQNSVVKATADGCVSGVEESALKPVAYDGQGLKVMLLSAELPVAAGGETGVEQETPPADTETPEPTETAAPMPESDPEATSTPEPEVTPTPEPEPEVTPEPEYANQLGMVVAVEEDGAWTMSVQPNTISVTDYTELGGIDALVDTMTASASYIPDAPIYSVAGGSRTQIGAGSVKPGDVLLFAIDGEKVLWIDVIGHYTMPGETEEPVTPTPTPSASGEMDSTTDTATTPNLSGLDISSLMGGNSDIAGMSGMDMPTISGMEGVVPDSAMQAQQAMEESLKKTILTVIPQDTMTLQIGIDEMDISLLSPGQTADITVDALPGIDFQGAVVQVGGSAQNKGGNTKYPVTLRMDRMELMLDGMNASAVITLDKDEDVLMIPVAALCDDGADCFVYTSYDEQNDVLGNPVYVTTGITDGVNVEILSGLSAGDTVWYSYYDALS